MSFSLPIHRSWKAERLLAALLCILAFSSSAYSAEGEDGLDWHRIAPTDVAGKGWSDTAAPFDRLPGKAERTVRPEVWDLSRHSSGLHVDFVTDAKSILARWTLTSKELASKEMSATGISGVDLYVHQQGNWCFLGAGCVVQFPTNTVQLTTGLNGVEAEYRFYFPVYNGVSSVEIGVPKGATFRITHPDDGKRAPVVIYGTSITQGGCVSRPGMSYTSILGRRLGVPIVNLGFAGNAKAEVEVAELLAELKASVFVLDPLANLSPEQVGERLPRFVEILRIKHPDTPILLVETPLFPDMGFSSPRAERVNSSNNQLRKVYEARRAAGDKHIQLVPACDLTVENGEGTVEGLHPNDLGMLQLASSIEPSLRAALEQ